MIARAALALAVLAGCRVEALYTACVNEARERWRDCADERRALARDGALDAFEDVRLRACMDDALDEVQWRCARKSEAMSGGRARTRGDHNRFARRQERGGAGGRAV